jgi:hypothetical protein
MSVQVVVDGETADLETVGDVLDCLAERERSEFVEASDHILFALAVEIGQRTTEFSLDLVDEAVECTLETGWSIAADQFTAEVQWDVAIGELAGTDDIATESHGERAHAFQERMHVPTLLRL